MINTRNALAINFKEAILDESQDNHYYLTPTNNRYASSTTILGATNREKDQALENWRNHIGRDVAKYITDESAIIGTQLHRMVECHIKNVFLDIAPRLISDAHFRMLKPLVNKIGDYYGNEICLWDDELGIAGTADCIAYYNGKLSIIDYKTKRRPQKEEYLWDHYLQLTSYAYMFQRRQRIPVEQVVLLVSNERNSRQEFIRDPREFFKEFLTRLNQYRKKN